MNLLIKPEPIMKQIIHEMFKDLNDFIFIDPKIPDPEKNYSVT